MRGLATSGGGPAERLGLRETCRLMARVYAEQARFLLPVALALFIPLELTDALAEHLADVETGEHTVGDLAGILIAVVVAVSTGAFGEVFYAGVAMAAVTESMQGHPRAPLGHLMRELPYGRLIVADLLFAVGLTLGLLLLIVPGIIFFARYVLVAPVLELERGGVRQSFRRSRQLTRGHRLAVLVLLGGLWLATDGLTALLQEGGIWALGESLMSDWAIAVVIAVLVTPVWAVAVCVMTWQLVERARA